MGEVTKRALIRDPNGPPPPAPARLYVGCCGNLIERAMPPLIAGTVCPTCGRIFDANGYVLGRAWPTIERAS